MAPRQWIIEGEPQKPFEIWLQEVYSSLTRLMGERRIENAWNILKTAIALGPEPMRKLWIRVVAVEDKIRRAESIVKGIDAYTTQQKREDARRRILEHEIYPLFMEFAKVIEELGIFFERFTFTVKKR